jgi:septum formation protein
MPLWLAEQPLVLASRSEVRGKILAAAGIRFELSPAQIDERALEAQAGVQAGVQAGILDAASVAAVLARAKAAAVAKRWVNRLVLGADQTLALGGGRFSKPANRAAAAEQLRQLRGKTHMLHSALALMRNDDVLFECVETAHLTMRNFSDHFLDAYLEAAGDAAWASVGAYQLEGVGVHLFERLEGDYFTILGLPLMPLLAYLRDQGFVNG